MSDPIPTTTGEMRAVGLDVELRDAIARWAADPDNPISYETWRSFAPAYRALLRRQADKLFGLSEIREVVDSAERLSRVREVIDHLASPQSALTREDTVLLLSDALGAAR